MMRTAISAAYEALAALSMRLLLEAQRGPQGGYQLEARP
jgi:DNA-binding IscR family transcriptional regulator